MPPRRSAEQDQIDRVAAAPLIAGQEPATPEYQYEAVTFDPQEARDAFHAEHPDASDAEMSPDFRPAAPLITTEQAARMNLSVAEIRKLREQGVMEQMVEYDEDAESYRLEKTKAQLSTIAAIDGGSAFQHQLSDMERYFAGLEPDKSTGKMVKRYPYMSPEQKIVGINGYMFHIPPFKKVMLPTEALAILEQSAMAKGQADVVSAIYAARQYEPISVKEQNGIIDPQGYHSVMQANHSVREEYRHKERV